MKDKLFQEVVCKKLQQLAQEDYGFRSPVEGICTETMAMEAQANNTFNRSIQGSASVAFIKRLLRRLISWYTNPFAQQQASFNHAAIACSANQQREIERLEKENFLLRSKLQNIEVRLEEIERKGGEGL